MGSGVIVLGVDERMGSRSRSLRRTTTTTITRTGMSMRMLTSMVRGVVMTKSVTSFKSTKSAEMRRRVK